MNTPDYIVENHGSLFLFRPQSDDAKRNLEDNVSEEAQWFGRALAVEHHFAHALAGQLREEGWVVE